jgi:hypothetical protein
MTGIPARMSSRLATGMLVAPSGVQLIGPEEADRRDVPGNDADDRAGEGQCPGRR